LKKHALMLTAAAVAMMARPALADTTITTKLTKVQTTSADGNIIIGTSTTSSSGTLTTTPGSVVVTAAGPVIEIDSNNYVNSTLAANVISNIGTNSAVGVWMDGLSGGNGPGSSVYALDNYGAINLTGSGTGKTGIMIGLGGYNSSSPPTSGVFNGGIHLESGSSLSVTGDSSYGIRMESGVVMNGNIALDGGIAMTPTNSSSTSAGSVIAVDLAGTLKGDFSVASTGTISATGSGAQGVVLAGDGALSGSFTNNGTIETLGISSTSASVTGTSTTYPEAGSAIVIGNSINGGFYNAGPASTGSTTARATIAVSGGGPAISITPVSTSTTSSTTVPVTIGYYTGELNGAYGFINRGTISVKPTDPDANAIGISMSGGSASEVTINGGIWNSGSLAVSATTDTKATQTISATGLSIGDYVKVPTLVNDNTESNSGSIAAGVSGVNSASATALYVGTNGELDSLVNRGSIIASVSTTDTKVATMSAYAIQDASGTLKSITNSGSITASATTLDNGTQTRIAADLSHNSTGITFTNTGNVIGDVLLGSGSDTLTVNGTSATSSASITGNISFNGGIDKLTIGDNAFVTGALTERGGGTVDVTVGTGSGTGTLTMTNSATTLGASTVTGLNVSNLTVNNGGTLNLTVSQPFNATNPTTATTTSTVKYAGPIISATGTINLDPNSNFNLNYGSFLSTPGGTGTSQFVLLDAPATKLTVGNYSAINTAVQHNIPYLFTGGLCGYNLAGSTACTPLSGSSDATAATDSQLVLQLSPKTVGTGPDQIPLTGNAAKIFSYANAAMANDDPLGAAMVSDVRDATTAKAAYSSFLPDLSGSSRQVAIDITDEATGPVGARQRALRMYASQPGGATLWGQEFADRDSSSGNVDAYRTNGWGIALGMDEGDQRNGRYGAALTFFSGDQTSKGPNFTKTSNLWYMLSGYTDWRGKGLFFDSQLSFGYGSLTGSRYLQLTDINNKVVYSRRASGKRAGLLLAAGFSTGAVLTYGSTVITPQFSLDGLTMREEGYTESGGGSSTTGADGFDLKVNPYYANSLRGYLGAAVRQDLNLGDFYIQPQLRVGYRYDFLADPVKLKAAFASMASATGSQFTLTGSDPQRGDLIGGLGLAVTTGAWSLGVDYDYVKGNGSSSTQAGMVTLVGRI